MDINGNTIKFLMRKHKVTIRGLAKKYGLTMKRVREVREQGVKGFSGDEWFMLIGGKWPSEAAAADLLEVWRHNQKESKRCVRCTTANRAALSAR